MANKLILHIDGDSFFASCEVSLNPSLRGRPVVTGQERGIASAMSKEAKALGVHRGMPIFKIKEMYPEVVVLSSSYDVYETFARRMFAIVRRYADIVEEYSIDECFALIDEEDTKIVSEIKQVLQKELGMTFSLGVSYTKTLAKLASSKNKPDGLTILEHGDINGFLSDLDVGKVWGIGSAIANKLRSKGIKTALELKGINEVLSQNFDKHTREIWYELNSKSVFLVHNHKEQPKSIQATRSFTPHTKDKKFLLSELSRNIENACSNMRGKNLSAKKIHVFLKTKEYRYKRKEISLDYPVSTPREVMSEVDKIFDSLYENGFLYKTTGVTLSALMPMIHIQNDLFGEYASSSKWAEVFKVVDKIDRKYGSHTITLASSLMAFKRRGGAIKKRLNLPYMGEIE